ncbi:MAG TPA: tyrosine-type recombinase/integrase [Rhodothermales bacterium]|nr:tyrosine-type recombinase/integrase [Rhodothermales bacterium]
MLTKRVPPHILRHTRATLLAEGGMSKDLLQIFLGHEKPETTEIYTYTAALDMRRGFNEAIKTPE